MVLFNKGGMSGEKNFGRCFDGTDHHNGNGSSQWLRKGVNHEYEQC